LSRELFPTVSELLERLRAGDQQALETLVPLVYKELSGLAHYHLRRERSGHTLQTTAFVNEAYVRLARGRPFEAENRTRFVAVAARVMRENRRTAQPTCGAALFRRPYRGRNGGSAANLPIYSKTRLERRQSMALKATKAGYAWRRPKIG
jgi:ECF sigma factor